MAVHDIHACWQLLCMQSFATESQSNQFFHAIIMNVGQAGSAGPTRYVQKQSPLSNQFDRVLT